MPKVHKITSLQYLKKNIKDEVDSLFAEKRQGLLQVDTIILGVCDQESPNYQKQEFWYFFAIS